MTEHAWLRSLGDSIAVAIARPDTRHAAFHGCYDWHSAVHGHAALLRLGRVLGERRYTELVLAALTPARLEVEAQLLRDEPAFEMPYGRAWLLRLAVELARTGEHRLDELAAEVSRSLVDRYDHVAPHPASREYASASWALAQLAGWARQSLAAPLIDWIQARIEDHFLDPSEVPDLDDDRHEPDFFSPRATWLYLLAHTQPEATLTRMLDAALDHRQLAPVVVDGRAHHYGVNWSRAWMLHRLALRYPGDPRLRAAYLAHVEVGIADHARAGGDYLAYGHWVPQFAVFALTEEAA